MKKKVSITIDSELLKQIEDIAKKQSLNRSKYIEKVIQKQTRQIPVLVLTANSKLGGKDKSLTLYNNKMLIDHQIAYIKNQGYNDIYVALNSSKLKNYLERNYPEVTVLPEGEKFGSGGSLKHHAERFGRRFIFMYCDILLDIDMNSLVQFHLRNKSSMTLVLKSMKEPSKYGVAVLEGSRISKFEEKPEAAMSHLVYIGLGVIDPEAAAKVKDGKLEFQLNDIENKFGYIYEGFWKNFEEMGDF